MYKYTVFILFILCCAYFQMLLSSKPSWLREKAPKIDLLRGYCKGYERAPIQLKNLRITKVNRTNYISGKLIVTQENYTQFHVILKSKRCVSRETLDTCEELQDVKINKVCEILKHTNQVWSPFIKSIHPPLHCPTPKGTYIINNGTFDVGPLVVFPDADKWYWKVQIELYEQDTTMLVLCIVMEGQITTL